MASAEHSDWKACPYEAAPLELDGVSLRRPNHFYHDSLGCPFECNDDHNHPKSRS